ncbi:cupin domain-containing protein [Mucilaginibacter sabulilitoris]|uniref:Cupin domain-containing protein n=1 Tax=Mucilaginibacter sabulilitoris TaxID=1173583 RepID=A0ABZ0TPQ8_9SPHI|nr:cupin domain-containing protein [Mucilaginibacter sabulilitoris]WPU94098.1 cupin domain-containing protein [Mucilaginibacter sabulilitoris]
MTISSANIVDLNEHSGKAAGGYKNFPLSEVNDHVIRMSIMTEDFYWHYHPNSDETFIVIEGTLMLDLETGTIELNKGQMITVPKNIAHRTRPKGAQSVNLTIELTAMKTVRIEAE